MPSSYWHFTTIETVFQSRIHGIFWQFIKAKERFYFLFSSPLKLSFCSRDSQPETWFYFCMLKCIPQKAHCLHRRNWNSPVCFAKHYMTDPRWRFLSCCSWHMILFSLQDPFSIKTEEPSLCLPCFNLVKWSCTGGLIHYRSQHSQKFHYIIPGHHPSGQVLSFLSVSVRRLQLPSDKQMFSPDNH